MGLVLNTTQSTTWLAAGVVFLIGLALFERSRRHFRQQWSRIQDEIETEIKRRELL